MTVKPKFGCPQNLLFQEADYILDAAAAHAAEINPRLPASTVDSLRKLLASVRVQASAQKSKTANVGGLTVSQHEGIIRLNDLVGRVKDTAKRAFHGQEVKLRNEFQVGVNSPSDLGSMLQRARTVRDAAANAANATALAAKGWLATDTTALGNAIDALDSTDNTQESAKTEKEHATDQRNTAANDLYEGLLTIQNAANIQWPERVAANASVRAQFRLGLFPPRPSRKATPAPAPAPSPAPSPTA